ncbi:hypothetical protein ZIOFF_016215 [Zingiber officinale]|uniref:UBA domain-containing protein n=1 Tax=Zingiber officinale TaxID=94328 RepID=A0A8J5I1F0_ZINOF|nr:hypothetical protein ZIOFF_016215 [Zingiber officinale]
MRPNIVAEAGLPTRLHQWWASVPFITSGIIFTCGIIYLVCLLVGYDSFSQICFSPFEIISHFQALKSLTFLLIYLAVYRMYTSVLFHGSLLHVLFNMLALVPLGTELERIMGSVRLLYLMLLLATINSIFHLIIALLVANNPLHPFPFLETECAIGFSGILFAMIVIETSLSGVQSRSVFGLFNVPAKWYAWILLILFQFLASNVSFLGHLCGILSGFALTVSSFVTSSRHEWSVKLLASWAIFLLFHRELLYTGKFSELKLVGHLLQTIVKISFCVRRPRFILCTGGTTYGQIPTYTSTTAIPEYWFEVRSMEEYLFMDATKGSITCSVNLDFPIEVVVELPRSPMDALPWVALESSEDPRFPGRGRTLGSTRNQSAGPTESDISLQARLLDNSTRSLETMNSATQPTAARRLSLDTEVGSELAANIQGLDNFEEELKKLIAMGFEKTQAEVALAAADGDPNVAIEILMSQQAWPISLFTVWKYFFPAPKLFISLMPAAIGISWSSQLAVSSLLKETGVFCKNILELL